MSANIINQLNNIADQICVNMNILFIAGFIIVFVSFLSLNILLKVNISEPNTIYICFEKIFLFMILLGIIFITYAMILKYF